MTLLKFNNIYQIQEKFVTISITISVFLISLDYIYDLQEYQIFLIYIFDFAVVVLIVIDFLTRFHNYRGKKKRFLIKHFYEIPAMVPIFVFGIVESLTIMTTSITIKDLEILALVKLIHIYFRTVIIFRNHHFLHLIMISLGAIIVGGFSMYYFESEQKEDSSVDTLGDGLWLIISTMTTVGYGDIYPVTTEGRIIASLTMFVGIAILWAFISIIGNNLVHRKINQQRRRLSDSNHSDKLEDKLNEDKDTLLPSVSDEMKNIIINRINNIDKLNEKELDMLIDTIRNLHRHCRTISK
ncbi:MAG: potassium channel family protein [Thermoproteota archaeon]|nr:potassium channel family protein [Thermoproteota archaeon]